MSANQELFKILERIGDSLDITPSQFESATEKYNAVGKWLSEGAYCLIDRKICLKNGEIYPQGSIKLETTVKPIGKDEFDVDLVFFTPDISSDDISAEKLRELIGNRLKEHKTYKKMLEPLNRGWCINYANEFHLDITPSLDNKSEPFNDSELVPDKKLKSYTPSNPKGYSKWFDNSASKVPTLFITRNMFESVAMDSATVSPLPSGNSRKLLLKRFVQLFKRHRDVMYEKKDNKPISIIITTLATKSYLYCIENFNYDNEYELMLDTLRYMTKSKFIKIVNGSYIIENPTVNGENFAEKWNEKPIRRISFYSWHKECTEFFAQFHENMGQHIIFESLEKGFGSPAKKVYNEITAKVKENRLNGLLGLGLTSTDNTMQTMKKNTFFGN